jgi:hypothetical protein
VSVSTAPEPDFTGDPLKDRLLDALLGITAELWVERDRRRILERLLAERGVVTPAEIEQYRSSPDEEAGRRAARDALVRRVFGGLRDLPLEGPR